MEMIIYITEYQFKICKVTIIVFNKSFLSLGLLFFVLFIYSHVHTWFGSFLHPAPLPLLPPLSFSVSGRSCSALMTDFVEEKT
jgi:hypothetical protein